MIVSAKRIYATLNVHTLILTLPGDLIYSPAAAALVLEESELPALA